MQMIFQEIKGSVCLAIKDSLSHSALIFNLSLAPFIYAVVAMYLYQGLNDGNSTFYMLLGAGAMGVWESTLMGGSWSLREEKEQGILEYYMCAPSSLLAVILGKCIVSALIGLVVLLEVFVIVQLNMNISLVNVDWYKLVIAFVMLMLSFSVMGYLLSFVFLIFRAFAQISNVLSDSIKFFCGVLFPITILPTAFRIISVVLPPTWGVEIVRTSLVNNENSFVTFGGAFGRMLGTSTLAIILTIAAFRLIEARIRRLGELSKI